MSLINKMLNELEKSKQRDSKRLTALSSITPILRKQQGALRLRLIILFMILMLAIGFVWHNRQLFISNLSAIMTADKTKTAPQKPKKQEKLENKTIVAPKPKATIKLKNKTIVAPKPKAAIKLQEIVLKQQDNQTILDFILSSPATYYIEHGPNKQRLFITLNNTTLLGNLPVSLENSFLISLDTKQNRNDTTITLALLPGTKVNSAHFVAEPKSYLHLVLSNPQLTDSNMSKTLTPLSPEQKEMERLKEIHHLLVLDRTSSAIHKLHLLTGDSPNNLQARTLLVSLLIKNGRVKKADEILMIGLNRHQTYIPFVKLKARILIKSNNPSAAAYLLEKHLDTTNDIELLAILAAIYQQQSKFMPAAKIYNKLTKNQPQESRWWVGLGLALENANKINAAREAYHQAYNSPNVPPELASFLNGKLKNKL